MKFDFLARVRRRMRFAWLLATAQIVAPGVAAALGVLALARWLFGIEVPWPLVAWTLAMVVLVLLLRSITMRISLWDAARTAEMGLGAHDVLSTSLEFTDPDAPLHLVIQSRATEVAQVGRVARALPFRRNDGALQRAGLAFVVAVALFLLPPLGAGLPEASAGELSALETEADALDELADRIEEASVEDADELSDELRELADQLRNADSLDSALRDLETTDQQLSADRDPQAMSRRAAVEGLNRELALNPFSSAAPLDASAQLEALADELAELGPEELAALTDRLRRLAEAQAAGNQAASSALSNAASSVAAGDLGAAADALRSAASGHRSGLAEARTQAALAEALSALGAASERLQAAAGRAGAGQGQGEGQGEGQGQGQGAGQGQGQGQGAGQGAGQGQGGTAGGGGAGQISGVTPSGQFAQGQGGVGSPGPGEADGGGTEVGRNTVFDPLDLGNTTDLLKAEIDGGSGDGALVGRGDAPTERGQTLVPYTQVLPDYLVSAAAALEQLDVPPSMREIIRTYFDRLAQDVR